MGLEYIFDPDEVRKTLQHHESLQQKMGDPKAEGTAASAFPRARKTGREIYRILCNQQYPHIKEVLGDLDRCIERGWEQPTLLRTRSGKEFDSAISELLVSRHFVRLGLPVSSFDAQKGQESVPDILVDDKSMRCSCEVYAPRDWDGYECFLEDLRLHVVHLDSPWDFRFEIKIDLISHFDQRGRVRFFDPWGFSDAYEDRSSRESYLEPIIRALERHLEDSIGEDVCLRFDDEAQNVFTELRINKVSRTEEMVPSRWGASCGPTLTGYAPEGMFDRLVCRRIRGKIGRKQAISLPERCLAALFVDVSHSGYAGEFRNPVYREKFADSIARHLRPALRDIDLVLFFQPNSSRRTGIGFPMLLKKREISREKLEWVVGEESMMDEIGEDVFVESDG